MENKTTPAQEERLSAQLLTGEALTRASGGVGYSSIQCKKCGTAFPDMDQYRKHMEAGCKGPSKR